METTFPLLPTVVGLLMCISSHASDPAVVMFCANTKWESGLPSPEQTDPTSVLGSVMQLRCALNFIGGCILGIEGQAFHVLGKYSVTSIPKKCFYFKQHPP